MLHAPAFAARHIEQHGRRRSDQRPRLVLAPSERHTLQPISPSDHMRGWVRFGMSQALPPDASPDMRAGYTEARNNAIDILTGQVSS